MVLMYNQSGSLLWQALYNGPGNFTDKSTAMEIDAAGNVLVTGYSRGLGTDDDIATVKYSPSGQLEWTRRYNGAIDSIDRASAMAIDRQGNIIVTGFSKGSRAGHDIVTIKYNTAGDSLWTRRFSTAGTDEANTVTVDDSGNVFMAGFSGGQLIIIKYNPSGDQSWIAYYNGSNSYDIAVDITLDRSGNVLVLGKSDASLSYSDYATVKYSASGQMLWSARYNGPGSLTDTPVGIAADDSGNVYVTGTSVGDNQVEYDYATIKYSSTGVRRWVKRYDGDALNGQDVPYSIVIDNSRNIYVTGQSVLEGFSSIATIKYNTFGDQVWVAPVSERFTHYHAYSMVLGAAGSVYLAGKKGNDMFAMKSTEISVGTEFVASDAPEDFSLEQNFPNPFNPVTRISYLLPESQKVLIRVYDMLGKEIAVLVNEVKNAGQQFVDFDGRNYPSGVYYYELITEGYREIRSMIMVK